MSNMYGHTWKSNYNAVCNDDGTLATVAKTWAAGLADITLTQISDGLAACLKRKGDFPPPLPEFRRMCKPEPTPTFHDEFDSLKLEFSPETDPDVAEAELDKMRELLG